MCLMKKNLVLFLCHEFCPAANMILRSPDFITICRPKWCCCQRRVCCVNNWAEHKPISFSPSLTLLCWGRRWQGLLLILWQSRRPAEQEAEWRCCTPLTWVNITRLATWVSGVSREPAPFPALSFFGKLG